MAEPTIDAQAMQKLADAQVDTGPDISAAEYAGGLYRWMVGDFGSFVHWPGAAVEWALPLLWTLAALAGVLAVVVLVRSGRPDGPEDAHSSAPRPPPADAIDWRARLDAAAGWTDPEAVVSAAWRALEAHLADHLAVPVRADRSPAELLDQALEEVPALARSLERLVHRYEALRYGPGPRTLAAARDFRAAVVVFLQGAERAP